jgi:hypothetical protein
MSKEEIAVPSTMTDLRKDLQLAYAERRRGLIDTAMSKDISNLAGKMIKSAVTQIDYAHKRGEKPNIPFMK